MAWLQNLADKAETLLVKFDQNAANVFNDTNVAHIESAEFNVSSMMETPEELVNVEVPIEVQTTKAKSLINDNESGFNDNVSIVSEKSRMSDNEDSGIVLSMALKRKTPSPTSNNVDAFGKKDFKSECSGVSSKSGSLHNSFIIMDDTVTKYEDKINKLECENDEINQQLINIRHLYSELQNENSNLQSQLERTNESLIVTQNEMEQYRARAQRILQEKEKLINLKQNNAGVENNDLIITTYNEELKKELKFQEDKNKELVEKLQKTTIDLGAIQQNFMFAQKDNQTAKQVLQDSLLCEKKIRSAAEEECHLKSKELQCRLQEIAHQNNVIASKSQEIFQLEQQLKQKVNPVTSAEVEERLQNLTHTLMCKQNNLEVATTERNALRLQLEKLESEYRRLLSRNQRINVKTSSVIDIDDGKSQIPQFLKISPFDMSVTRKVKHAYSSLNAISIRTGVFLRRYPVARVFVFCYIVMLHIWVLIILCTYIPSTSH
ncbi:hypothetical protein RN001_016250 [Aquatica leii]|uniref:Golgin-84 n=1 Tax=Aquatica leii TaxID=1421715 RepID=A0AAN7NZ49_9COLE|nr:hypothetical protein RN001_016250 [Aquatica leii]